MPLNCLDDLFRQGQFHPPAWLTPSARINPPTCLDDLIRLEPEEGSGGQAGQLDVLEEATQVHRPLLFPAHHTCMMNKGV